MTGSTEANKKYIDGYSSMYKDAKKELTEGKKKTHWMWFIFPQLKGLGRSAVSDFYGLNGINDAKAFYSNGYLRRRLNRLFKIVKSYRDKETLENCFGRIDTKKFHSCATLFYLATKKKIFRDAIDKFFGGVLDEKTLSLL